MFRKSRLWKRGLIQGVQMLPRNESRKPRLLTPSEKGETQASSSLVSVMRMSMTPVQAKKQAVPS